MSNLVRGMKEDISMKGQLLGYAIKEDRKKLGITQAALQQKVRAMAIKNATNYTKKEREALLSRQDSYTELGGKSLFVPIAAKLISNIERGLARTISEFELSIIATALGFNYDRYFGYELNPMKILSSDQNDINQNSWFDRSIEFDPEYRQAGVSILSFFSEVVRSEYSDQDVRIGILQEGSKVTLRVETPEGKLLEEIEKTLEKYGLIVMGGAPVESLSENRELIRDLKTKLEVTSLELRLRQDSHLENKKQYENRILTLEDQVRQLHGMIGSSLAHHTNLTEIIRSIINDNGHVNNLGLALETINNIATSDFSEESASKLKETIGNLEKESPGLTKRLAATMETIPANVMSSLASPWVQSIISSLL